MFNAMHTASLSSVLLLEEQGQGQLGLRRKLVFLGHLLAEVDWIHLVWVSYWATVWWRGERNYSRQGEQHSQRPWGINSGLTFNCWHWLDHKMLSLHSDWWEHGPNQLPKILNIPTECALLLASLRQLGWCSSASSKGQKKNTGTQRLLSIKCRPDWEPLHSKTFREARPA